MIDQLSTILVFVLLLAFIFKYWIYLIVLFILTFIIIILLC